MRVIFFFGNVQNSNEISKISQKIQKNGFVFEIIASEYVALNGLIKKRILAIGTQCIRKQFCDFAYH